MLVVLTQIVFPTLIGLFALVNLVLWVILTLIVVRCKKKKNVKMIANAVIGLSVKIIDVLLDAEIIKGALFKKLVLMAFVKIHAVSLEFVAETLIVSHLIIQLIALVLKAIVEIQM